MGETRIIVITNIIIIIIKHTTLQTYYCYCRFYCVFYYCCFVKKKSSSLSFLLLISENVFFCYSCVNAYECVRMHPILVYLSSLPHRVLREGIPFMLLRIINTHCRERYRKICFCYREESTKM